LSLPCAPCLSVLISKGYAEFITRYNRASALFYLDPPDWGSEDDYCNAMFAAQDSKTLARWVKVAKGKALMSTNDVPVIREIFAWFHMEEVHVTYTVARKETTKGRRGEVLLRNF
jgi:DNA adenine methylase